MQRSVQPEAGCPTGQPETIHLRRWWHGHLAHVVALHGLEARATVLANNPD
jgi:hypothetical protein